MTDAREPVTIHVTARIAEPSAADRDAGGGVGNPSSVTATTPPSRKRLDHRECTGRFPQYLVIAKNIKMSFYFKDIWPIPSRKMTIVVSALVFLAAIGAAQAQDFCPNIDYLIDQSRSEFAGIADKPTGAAGDHDVTLTLAGASYCLVTKKSKRNWYHCGWEFPYRAKRAYDTFDEFVAGMNECIGPHATLHTDQSVNHPDYYASRRYEMEQANVSVSVKDKGALGSTFVFIRVQGREIE